MKFRFVAFAVLFGILAAAPGLVSPFGASAAFAQEAPSAQAFARRPAIASPDISPDGRHIVAIVSNDGASRHISIWRVDALDQAPFNVGSDPRSEIVSVQFIKNDRIFVVTRQLVSHNPYTGAAERSYASRQQILDLQGRPIRTSLRFDGLTQAQQEFTGVGGLVNSLPRDPQNILVAAPRTRDIYRLNLYTGRAERVERGSTRFSPPQTDLDGEPRARSTQDYDSGAFYSAQYLRHPDTGAFEEHFRSYARDRSAYDFRIAALTNDPNVILVRSSEGRDRAAIFEYDIRNRQIGEVAFAHPQFEAGGVIRSRSDGEILGFSYSADRNRVHWIDPVLATAEAQLRSALRVERPTVDWIDIDSGARSQFQSDGGADVSIVARSDDKTRLIAVRSGVSTPPEYYLLMDNRLALLGRSYPELREAPLGRPTVLQYEARDGLMIPAILTRPDPAVHGAGPYRTIVLPHGGPWARDSLTWDTPGWVQYFVTRGYAVLQPQFRGSTGWGHRLWVAGDREWGRAMQDDLDDGVRWLIAQGIADPERVVMHGYSYGGYAAMMAAVRPNGLYRCAVAGAGPASLDLFKKGTYNNRFLREFQHPTAEGEDPIRRVGEVSIPIYLYTGDRDTNVLPSESRSFASALERAGKTVQLRILPEMEHSDLTPANFADILTSIEEFYNETCGLNTGVPVIQVSEPQTQN